MTLTVRELRAKMQELGIDRIHYSIDENGLGENHVLRKKSDGWEVYFSERGSKWLVKEFHNEHAACEYFLKFILEDSVVMRDVAEKKR